MSGMMEDKIVIVTGGTGGLGRHIVDKYAKAGWKVYLPVSSLKKFMTVFDNSQDDDSSFTLRKIYAFECDVLNEEYVIEFVQKIAALEKGKLDVLVNTVGGYRPPVNTNEISTKDFDELFNLNFKTTLWFSREVLKVMLNNKQGRIVSISSMAALESKAGLLNYTVSKSAVVNLMETINKEFDKDNIKCYAIAPTVIDTPANREWGTNEDIKKWVKPEDIADTIFNLNDTQPVVIKMGME
jgi:NAD(P)-dependent dehydrogenase (short-subunit alcohol dehydrogenase family)